MPRQYNIFGTDDAESFLIENLTKYIQEGQNICTGYKYLLIEYRKGDYKSFCTLENTEENIAFQTLNLQVDNKKLWTLKPQLVYNRDYSDWISCMCSINDTESNVPICIINPDILPRIDNGEKLQAQVIAFSIGLDTFATEEEMENTFPTMNGMETPHDPEIPDMNGKKIGIAQGSIFPLGFLSRHQVDYNDNDAHKTVEYDYADDVGSICGKIIRLRELDRDDEENIDCHIITVNTEYGELDICVAADDTDYSVGRYILGNIFLSANVKIGEYENGAIFDKQHLAKLLYDAIENKDFSRFENVLANDCNLSQSKSVVGKQNVIAFLQNLIETNSLFSEDDIKFDIDKNGVLLIYTEEDNEAESYPISFKFTLTDKKIDSITIKMYYPDK